MDLRIVIMKALNNYKFSRAKLAFDQSFGSSRLLFFGMLFSPTFLPGKGGIESHDKAGVNLV